MQRTAFTGKLSLTAIWQLENSHMKELMKKNWQKKPTGILNLDIVGVSSIKRRGSDTVNLNSSWRF